MRCECYDGLVDTQDKIGAPIVEKMVEFHLRWFGHMWRNPIDDLARRVNQMEGGSIVRGGKKSRKTIGQVIMRDLELK